MGAKTWMLVVASEHVPSLLSNKPILDRDATENFVQNLFPKETLESIEDGDLSYTCPPDDEIYAGCYNGVTIVAAKEFGIDYPSKLDSKFLVSKSGTTTYLHAMHSVSDWFAFSIWEDGHLVRSLSLSSDDGVLESIGEKLPFEVAYWDGEHPAVEPEEMDEYPLPFHPLELGEEVLKEFFGYQLEGYTEEALLVPEEIVLAGYKRKKPSWKFW